jgi:hypothetical protein
MEERIMQYIQPERVQMKLQDLQDKFLYAHLEMTTGAYASHRDKSKMTASVFFKNAPVRYSHGTIAGAGPYRIGLKTNEGWIYAEGLTHWEESDDTRLIMAGHDSEGRLLVSFMLSVEPF